MTMASNCNPTRARFACCLPTYLSTCLGVRIQARMDYPSPCMLMQPQTFRSAPRPFFVAHAARSTSRSPCTFGDLGFHVTATTRRWLHFCATPRSLLCFAFAFLNFHALCHCVAWPALAAMASFASPCFSGSYFPWAQRSCPRASSARFVQHLCIFQLFVMLHRVCGYVTLQAMDGIILSPTWRICRSSIPSLLTAMSTTAAAPREWCTPIVHPIHGDAPCTTPRVQ